MDELTIKGIIINKLKIISSEKGDVLHMLRNDENSFKSFGECYFSEVNPDKIKGWKKHNIQNQFFSVPVGRLKLVLYDDRASSETYKTINEIILGRPDSYYRINIPPGIYYSFKCLTKTPALIVNCTDIPHSIDESLTLELNNTIIPYKWS